MYNAWQQQFAPLPPQVVEFQGQQGVPPAVAGQPPALADSVASQATGVPTTIGGAGVAAPAMSQQPQRRVASILKSDQRIHVRTDLLDIEIDTVGGDIRWASLLAYPVKIDQPDQPVQLFDDRFPQVFIAQSGLLSSSGTSVDHNTVFIAERLDYQLNAGEDTVQVPLTWTSANGIVVTKTYTFHRNQYVIDMDVQLSNGTGQDWTGRLYRQLQRTEIKEKNQSGFIYTYMGGVVSTPEDVYQKIDFDEMYDWRPEPNYSKGGWAAMIQHYFFAAWIPRQDESNNFYTSVVSPNQVPEDNRYIIGFQTVEKTIAAGQSDGFYGKLYIGPKEQRRLVKVAPHLELTVDYGVLTILAQPVYWLLDKIHGFLGNWGFAIIVVTMLIKAVFYKLSEAAYRSMARMRKFQPKLKALKERYGDDKQAMSKAMMEIYKKEKINPLGGCLPIMVQIPVFIALYWVLLETVELRQADFILWIHDLSAKDPFYVLPVLMGISMFIQHKLNPAPMDPVQQKIFQMLPIVFTIFFAFFPSGLVLYWVVNNVLSIAQQWYITQKIAKTP